MCFEVTVISYSLLILTLLVCGDISDVPKSLPSPESSQGVSTEGDYDRCRADDKVRCADGSVFICTDQQCDGKRDCPGGDDEENCPDDKNGLSKRIY